MSSVVSRTSKDTLKVTPYMQIYANIWPIMGNVWEAPSTTRPKGPAWHPSNPMHDVRGVMVYKVGPMMAELVTPITIPLVNSP